MITNGQTVRPLFPESANENVPALGVFVARLTESIHISDGLWSYRPLFRQAKDSTERDPPAQRWL
jgi:hypothetical protein